MSNNLSRRKALATGAAMTGILAGANATPSQAWNLPDVGGEKFLNQWSPDPKVKRNLTPGSSHIRLSCVANGLGNTNGVPTAQVEKIRAAGWTAAEVMSSSWKKMTDSEVRELQAALKQHDLLFYNIHVWDNIIHPNPEKRASVHKEYLRAIECAEQMGLEFFLGHTGGRGNGGADVPHPDNWTEETWKMSVDALKKVIADSPGSKVKIAIEAINSNNMNNPAAHVRLKKDVGSDRIAVTLDPTNMMHPGVVFRSTELINTCFETIPEEDIMYCHGKDVRWGAMLPGLSWTIPGQGTMDYEVYLTHLSRLKKPRVMMLEFLNGTAQYDQARKYVEDTAAKVGVKIYGK